MGRGTSLSSSGGDHLSRLAQRLTDDIVGRVHAEADELLLPACGEVKVRARLREHPCRRDACLPHDPAQLLGHDRPATRAVGGREEVGPSDGVHEEWHVEPGLSRPSPIPRAVLPHLTAVGRA
eukprot:1842012-Pyramimonas_sp.AAC.1